ncbi:hypothetical protein B9Z55_016013 [Caenorhabditis nigoni]|uniref:Serpentine receptor class gamma n=1 Tax=Caenorhabditis nigoni TaxID=1611254 RepID=A0A2G5UDD7_9PELO|nr:hypothetical protein B9Z55_016013 [Caenorhabditis nigoni]
MAFFTIVFFFAIFEALVIILQMLYFAALIVLHLNSPFHLSVITMSLLIMLRASVTLYSIISWDPDNQSSMWLEISHFLDYISWNYSMAVMLVLAVHQYVMYHDKERNMFYFMDWHGLLLIFVFAVMAFLGIGQIGFGSMKRGFSYDNGIMEVSSTNDIWIHCWMMKINYIFPILTIAVYTNFILKNRKLNPNVKQNVKIFLIPERNRAILIIFISILQLAINILNEFHTTTAEATELSQKAPIDKLLTFSYSIPELFTPFFIFCNFKKFRDHWKFYMGKDIVRVGPDLPRGAFIIEVG